MCEFSTIAEAIWHYYAVGTPQFRLNIVMQYAIIKSAVLWNAFHSTMQKKSTHLKNTVESFYSEQWHCTPK